MSPLLCCALSALIVASACSCPKPPESSVPEAPRATSPEPGSVPATPAEPFTPPAATALGEGEVRAGSKPALETLLVRERRADCVGEGTTKCLQVREAESDEWRNFYASIEGFEYEESHAYELRVEVTEVAQPKADGASLRYRLIEIISKRKVPPP